MTTDLRSVHWREIKDHINTMRRRVHDKLGILREATAKEIAEYMATDKTSVRPRLTELVQLGLAAETGARRNSEHVFRYVSVAVAERAREQRDRLAIAAERGRQQELFA